LLSSEANTPFQYQNWRRLANIGPCFWPMKE